MDKITLTIDGKTVEVASGATVLEAAKSVGIYIPTLCYFEDLEPYGGCRLCVVEIEKMRGMPIACTTPATDGMVVKTNSPDLLNVRRTALELLLSNHPCECLTCDRRKKCGPNDICLRSVGVTDRCALCPSNGDCELQKVAEYLDFHEMRLPHNPREYPVDTSNPFFVLDRNKCILCARCVRACNEITGVGAIDMAYRGSQMKVATLGDKPLMESICKSCGECMVRCPVGALAPKDMSRPDSEVKTTCPYCGVGCEMYLGIKDGRIVSVRGDKEGKANKSRLCVKGRFGIKEFVHSPERLTKPLIRKNGVLEEATWDEALNYVAQKLAGFTGDEIAVLASAKSTNEDNYVIQKFARAVLHTNNVDHCARL